MEYTQEQVGQVSEVVLEVASEEASEEELVLEQLVATIICEVGLGEDSWEEASPIQLGSTSRKGVGAEVHPGTQ